MKTELITIAQASVEVKEFKDERLTQATAKIARIYSNALKYADEKNREISTVLAEVAEQKSYEKDGFKSVADYAYKTFGIARQNAYALANAGKVYNDETTPDSIKEFSPSKLVELNGVARETIEQAIQDGTISKDTTQKGLRDFAKANRQDKKESKTVVLEKYTARICTTFITEELEAELSKGRIMEDWDTFFKSYCTNELSKDESDVEIVKLPKGYAFPDAKKATIERKLYFNKGISVVVEFRTYVPTINVPKKEEQKQTFTIEQLQEMLAAAMAAQAENSGDGFEENAEG